jgi:hypothetical protein
MVMARHGIFLGMGLVAAGCLLGGRLLTAGEAKEGHAHAGHFEKCAKACANCMLECESCARHCSELVSAGKKEHLHTLGTCADCGDTCGTAGKIVARRGPMAGLICEACVKACVVCAGACEKMPDDAHMQHCAKACRDCAQACRDMLEHTGKAARQ